MANELTILVGTAGQGIMRSGDGGESCQRVATNQGMYQNPVIRVLVNHPSRPNVIYAGTDKGVFRSSDGGQNWQSKDSPLNRLSVWTIAIDPSNPDTMYAGTGTPSPRRQCFVYSVGRP
jgi:photosystem II stability/assembly factor-like uncharacterized protein